MAWLTGKCCSLHLLQLIRIGLARSCPLLKHSRTLRGSMERTEYGASSPFPKTVILSLYADSFVFKFHLLLIWVRGVKIRLLTSSNAFIRNIQRTAMCSPLPRPQNIFLDFIKALQKLYTREFLGYSLLTHAMFFMLHTCPF